MTLKNQVEQAKGNAALLEQLYRRAVQDRKENVFREAIDRCLKKHPEDELFSAWAYRLDIHPLEIPAIQTGEIARRGDTWHWLTAIIISIILGTLFIAFAGDQPPIPVPKVANPLFWIGWGPLTASAILLYLALTDTREERKRLYAISTSVIVLVTLFAAWVSWGKTDDIANLIAIHLPFVSWAAIGGSVAFANPGIARQYFSFLVRSVETIVAAGVYLIAGVIFYGLTFGLFSLLGISFSAAFNRTVFALGIGVIPVLALASAYDPSVPPMNQRWTTGLARILKILTRLLLPLALGVLAIYVFWFIPSYFWSPFKEREVLIVYNATLITIIAMLIVAVPGLEEKFSSKLYSALRYAIVSTGLLTFLLNAYALAAIISRTYRGGLTPNRHAVLGWNVVTLAILAVAVIRLWIPKSDKWEEDFQYSIGQFFMLPIIWSLWVTLALSFF